MQAAAPSLATTHPKQTPLNSCFPLTLKAAVTTYNNSESISKKNNLKKCQASTCKLYNYLVPKPNNSTYSKTYLKRIIILKFHCCSAKFLYPHCKNHNTMPNGYLISKAKLHRTFWNSDSRKYHSCNNSAEL